MAVYKDIPRFDGSGITEYYRVNTGEIVKLSNDYDSLEDKPLINGVVLEGDLTTADLNIPLGDLEQLKTNIKDNIVNAINELHLDAETFEQSITNKVNSIISFTIVWVEKLPAAKDAHHNTVYLVPKTSMAEEGNYCEEYLYTDHGWEKIGDTKVDLSGYYTKTEVDAITDELTEQVDTILEDYATKEELENRADALEEQVDAILEDYATKQELEERADALEEQVDTILEDYATKQEVADELTNYATKDSVSNDLTNLENKLTEEMDEYHRTINSPTYYKIAYDPEVGGSYDDQVKQQLSRYLPLASDAQQKVHAVLLYEQYDTNMNFVETLSFSNWMAPKYIELLDATITNISTNNQFALNEDGYYESNCQGVGNGYALCKVSFTLDHPGDISFEYINQGENTYDYGLFSKLDTTFTNNNSTESTTTIFHSCKTNNDAKPHTITYSAVPAGEHFIHIKYRKDSGGNTGLDSLQFKILPITSSTQTSNSSQVEYKVYSYQQNINSNHCLNFAQDLNSREVIRCDLITIDRAVKSYIIEATGPNTNFNLSPHIEKFRAWYEDYRNDIVSNIIIKTPSYLINNMSSGGDDSIFILDRIHGWTSTDQPYRLKFRTMAPAAQSTGMVDAVDILTFYLSYDTDGSLKTVHSENSYPLKSVYRDAHLQPLNYREQSSGWSARLVLTADNTEMWEPTGDYNPATKKYVDDYKNTIALINYRANAITKYWNNNKEFGDTKPTADLQLKARGTETAPQLTYTLEQPVTIKAGTTVHFHAPYKNSSYSSYMDDVKVWFDIMHNGQVIYTSDRKIYYTKYGTPSPMYSNDLYYDDITVDDIQLLPGDQIRFYWYGYFVYYDNQFIYSTPTEPTYIVIYNQGVSASNVYAANGLSIVEYVDEEISNIKGFGVEIVETLPTENISLSTVYMVPSTNSVTDNVKDEYLYTEHGWEMIGSTVVDLSNYYNKGEVDTLVANAEGNIKAAKDYTDERIDALYLHCSELEYNALSQLEKESFLVAIVEDMAESGSEVEALLQEILMDVEPTETEDDLTEEEAMSILDEIIGGIQ